MTPIICIVGKSKSGKTILIEKLIKEFKKRNYKVATLKHDVHGYNVDHPGKDTWLHAQAGADCVTICSPNGIAMIKKTSRKWTLDQLIALNDDADIIIAEGFRLGDKPKIEVVWAARSTEPMCSAEELIAVATDAELELQNVPVIHINDVIALADIIEEKIVGKSSS